MSDIDASEDSSNSSASEYVKEDHTKILSDEDEHERDDFTASLSRHGRFVAHTFASPKMQEIREAITPPTSKRHVSRIRNKTSPAQLKSGKKKREPDMTETLTQTHLTSILREDDKRHRVTYSDFVALIGKCIRNNYNLMGDVDIDENCLTFQIMCMKERCNEHNRWLIGDNDTRYENMCDRRAKYTHTCQYEQRSSISLQMRSGHKFGFGASLGGGFAGAIAGVGGGYEYSRGKSMGEAQDEGKLKTSAVEIYVEPFTAVIVKELTFVVEKTALCEVELYLQKENEIKYTCNETEKPKETMKFKDLWNKDDGLKSFQWAKEDGSQIVCFLATTCHFLTIENRMETVKLQSDMKRCDRIIKSCTFKE